MTGDRIAEITRSIDSNGQQYNNIVNENQHKVDIKAQLAGEPTDMKDKQPDSDDEIDGAAADYADLEEEEIESGVDSSDYEENQEGEEDDDDNNEDDDGYSDY